MAASCCSARFHHQSASVTDDTLQLSPFVVYDQGICCVTPDHHNLNEFIYMLNFGCLMMPRNQYLQR
jgi:hypothetical protein